MKFLKFAFAVFAALALLTPTDGHAQPGPDNVVGLYLNADGTGATETFEVGASVSVYLVLTNPTDVNNNNAPVTDISAFECQLNFSGGMLFKLADTLPPITLNVGDNSDINQGFLEYIVGMGTPYPVTAGSVVLVSFQFLAISSDETIVTLGPTSTSGIPGEMTYYPDPGQPRIMYSAGGSHAAPVFRFNPVVPTPIDDIQEYDPLAGTPMSPYDAQEVTVTGTVYAVKGTLTTGGFYLQDTTGGINYYAPDAEGIAIGDRIRATATVADWGGEVYFHDDPLPDFEITGTGPEPDPRYFTVSDLVTDFENVGWFVAVEGTVSGLTADGFVLTQGLDAVPVFISPVSGIDLSGYQDGDRVAVQGACVIRNGEIQVWPRYQTDLVTITGPRIFYVAKTGSDETGDGSEGNPFATIQRAIDRTIDLDEVWVLPETYTGPGNRDIDFLGKAITVKSRDEDATTCIIDCEGSELEPHRGFIFQTGEDAMSVLQYVSVTGGGGFEYGGGVLVGSILGGVVSSPILRECIIEGNEADFGGGMAVFSGAYVDSCVIVNNSGTGIFTDHKSGATFQRCTVSNNTGSGIVVDGLMPNVGFEEGFPEFTSCWIDSNDVHGIAWGAPYPSADWAECKVIDCKIRGNGGWGLYTDVYEDLFAEVVACTLTTNGLGGMSLGGFFYSSISESVVEGNLGPGLLLNQWYQWDISNCQVLDNRGHGITFGGGAKSSKAHSAKQFLRYQIFECDIALNDGRGIDFQVMDVAELFFVEGCLISANGAEGIGVDASYSSGASGRLDVLSTTIAANGGAGVSHSTDLPISIENVIIAQNAGPGVLCTGTEIPQVSCTDIWGNTGGDWVGCVAPQATEPGNISVDPLFCGDGNGTATYTLMEISPCAAANSACGRIGALGVDCQALPVIESIVDVGNDQGRNVRLSWFASDYDQAESIRPITEYGIYRRIDGYKNAAEVAGAGEKFAGWDFIERVPARADSFYQFVAPTLCDSTVSGGLCLSTFIVSGMTASPAIYYDSLPDSGYSVDNLSPDVPEGLSVAYSSEQNVLTWAPAAETDFSHYLVYRDLKVVNPFARTTEHYAKVFATTMTDSMFGPGHDAWDYDYTLVAVDFAGNASPLADPSGVSDVDDGVLPTQLSLGTAYPNPFNPMTTIVYEVPSMMPVSIRIFDVAGRLVRILVDGADVPAGRHEVVWKGRDERGKQVAAGVYFYQLEAGSFADTNRMTLVK